MAVPDVEVAWRWFHRSPAGMASSLFDGALSDRAEIHEVGRPHRFVVAREGRALVLRREDGALDSPSPELTWSRRFPVGAAGAPVVGRLTADAVFAAAPTADGYTLLAVDPESGEPRWTVHHGVEGVDGVQLGTSNDADVLVYVSAAQDAVVHVLRAEDGSLVGRARHGSEVRRPFSPPALHTAVMRGRLSDSGHRLVRADAEHHAIVGPGWRQPLPNPDPFSTHATFIETPEVLVVVTHCNGASGSSVYGLDPATGAVRWQTSGGSIGFIGHSRYANDVRAQREGELIRVYGEESSGRYVGTVDPAAGRLLGYEVWRR